MTAEPDTLIRGLPLFPLQVVLFPGMRLKLKVFETRYLDLMARCLREQQPFGVVRLRQGSDMHLPQAGLTDVQFEPLGVLASVTDVDAPQAGLLHVTCTGGQRFQIEGKAAQGGDGLWIADVRRLPDDAVLAPEPDQLSAVRALANAIGALERQGSQPFDKPFRFDDAGWVANRWCELLPISLEAKQRLMALPEPLIRLRLVADYLRGKGVID